MLNAFARLAIAYYRMTFKMLSTRPVFIQPVKAGTEEASGGKRQSGTRYAEIKKYWASFEIQLMIRQSQVCLLWCFALQIPFKAQEGSRRSSIDYTLPYVDARPSRIIRPSTNIQRQKWLNS